MEIAVGMLGCARIGKVAMVDPCRQATGLRLGGVASRDPAKAQDYADEHGIPRAYEGYEDLLADPAIDAIYNPLPNGLHEKWSVAALEAGKPVLCEKPLTANAQGARRMANVARSKNLPLLEAFHYRFHPLALFIDQLLADGRLGTIESVSATFEIPGDLVPADDIRFQYELAGGSMMDLGAYCISAVRWLTGEEPCELDAVAKVGKPQIDSAMDASLVFPSGATGKIHCALAGSDFKAQLTVTGSRGALCVTNPFLPHHGHQLDLDVEGGVTTHQFDLSTTYYHQARAFAEVVRGERDWLPDLESSIQNMAMIDQVYRSAGMLPR